MLHNHHLRTATIAALALTLSFILSACTPSATVPSATVPSPTVPSPTIPNFTVRVIHDTFDDVEGSPHHDVQRNCTNNESVYTPKHEETLHSEVQLVSGTKVSAEGKLGIPGGVAEVNIGAEVARSYQTTYGQEISVGTERRITISPNSIMTIEVTLFERFQTGSVVVSIDGHPELTLTDTYRFRTEAWVRYDPKQTPCYTVPLVPSIEVQKLDIPFSSRNDLPLPIPVPHHLITAGKTSFVLGNHLYVWVFVCAQQATRWCAIQELPLLPSGEWESPIDIGNQEDDCGLFDLHFAVVNSEANTNLTNLTNHSSSQPPGISQHELPGFQASFQDVDVFKVKRGLNDNGNPLPNCNL